MLHDHIVPITDLSSPELEVYSSLSENQLFHYYEPEAGLFIAESPIVIGRALDAGYQPVSILAEERELKGAAAEILARCGEVPVYVAPMKLLKQITGFSLTRGLLCAMRRKQLPSIEQICAKARRIVVLENVVNPTNVGAIFRSAAALNMDAVLLTSGCSDPLYRRSVRVSMGTVFQIPWTVLKHDSAWPHPAMELLRGLGFKTAAMALTDRSVRIDDPCVQAEEKLAIVLGTEGDGFAKETIADCDHTIRIPMSHGVDSLNVAAASAVAFWQLGNHHTEGGEA